MKGCGEVGAIGCPPAVINAVVDALRDYGVRHIDMPATPQKIWSIIQAGAAADGGGITQNRGTARCMISAIRSPASVDAATACWPRTIRRRRRWPAA